MEFEGAIEEYNDRKEVKIIAMITYPKVFLDYLLRKGKTKKIILYSKIPVLAIPAR